jgi:hypothetical protein
MIRQARTSRAATILLGMLVAALILTPGAVAARGSLPPAAAPRERPADLAPALGADGSFRGTAGLAGTVDANAWTLVSNLAAGEPPRFAPAGVAVATPIGPWSALGSNGSGDGAIQGEVLALAVAGSDLYVGGNFVNAAGIAKADYIAKWNGSAWSALGSDGAGHRALNATVFALAISGSDLYAGGNFYDAAGIPEADRIAKWNGSAWFALGSNDSGNGALRGTVLALEASGGDLFVGGSFTNAAGIPEADDVAEWDGNAWSALGSNGSGDGALSYSGNDVVFALAVSGSDLYVGGFFTDAAGIPEADSVAGWNGSAWFALGSDGSGDGVIHYPSGIYALAAVGSTVYVGGGFTNAAGIPEADYLAKWNGSAWSALGSNGAGNGAINSLIRALVVSDGDVYAGGWFTDPAGIATADSLARWNGTTWSALGSNGSGDGALDSRVWALAVSGSALYVGGDFTSAAGIATADHVAEWALGVRKPDGRIRLGTGAFVGNDIYNTTGVGQRRHGSAPRGSGVTFGISIQNDGNGADRFTVKATGSVSSGYTVRYFRGATDITAEVVGGTYQTWSLAPAATYLITARVTVHSAAAVGSKVMRLVTLTSVGNGAKKDAVKFIGKRA